jgi:aryl-alcohol dehydrogenase-like predicted oxidoreductase
VIATSGAPSGPERLILGTAQFSGGYGLLAGAFSDSSYSDAQALDLIAAAERVGISALDTAPAYGQAEQIVGSSSWTGEVWTKLDPALRPEESVARSLEHLNRSRLDVLYVHDVNHFLRLDHRVLAEIQALRGRLVDALGVSAYELTEVRLALNRLDFDVVQLPVNPFDARLVGALATNLLPSECTYVGRSVFLQGLLAQPELALMRAPEGLRAAILRWRSECERFGVAPGEAALTWALSVPFLERVIVGVESLRQLEEVASWSESDRCSEILEWVPVENLWPLSDPRTWPALSRPNKE